MPAFSCTAILFDMDGVLVDSTLPVERHWRNWAQRKGLDANAILAVSHGMRTIEVIRAVAPHLDAEAEVRAIENLEATDIEGLTAMPGAVELVRSVPDGHWGVVTSGPRDLQTGRLKLCGLPVPRVFVTADDVKRGKPDPEPYLKGAEWLGFRPAECLVIEDAPSGIASARAAGMKVIGMAGTFIPEKLAEADAVVRRLSQVRVSANGAGSVVVEIEDRDKLSS
jgi:mannitol-1-/sugar-/sorbitol-6-phosphatase